MTASSDYCEKGWFHSCRFGHCADGISVLLHIFSWDLLFMAPWVLQGMCESLPAFYLIQDHEQHDCVCWLWDLCLHSLYVKEWVQCDLCHAVKPSHGLCIGDISVQCPVLLLINAWSSPTLWRWCCGAVLSYILHWSVHCLQACHAFIGQHDSSTPLNSEDQNCYRSLSLFWRCFSLGVMFCMWLTVEEKCQYINAINCWKIPMTCPKVGRSIVCRSDILVLYACCLAVEYLAYLLTLTGTQQVPWSHN